jgi:hypothetical protein
MKGSLEDVRIAAIDEKFTTTMGYKSACITTWLLLSD